MAERYDSFTVLTVGEDEKAQLYKLVAFLNNSYLKKDSAMSYLRIYDVLTQHKSEMFKVYCKDDENDTSSTYQSKLVDNQYRQESVEFTGEDLHKAVTIAMIIK